MKIARSHPPDQVLYDPSGKEESKKLPCLGRANVSNTKTLSAIGRKDAAFCTGRYQICECVKFMEGECGLCQIIRL